ncbi:lysosome-associated membrane glycoprotein 1 [Aplysia californica]|uniref:Lysosome-associated membrane glycoprotein 5 n=1 Tax=Aplysia californica TaxID=6500 RepID=A0ABM0K2E1_APLCA|nr:lysosome-associated membrane glycoprotein 1 [Aplysia californica]
MKIVIFAVLLAVASAKKFSVEKSGNTCAMLVLSGKVDATASNGTQDLGSMSLPFDSATLIADSNCTLIKLNLTSSVEVWFQLDGATAGAQQIQPIAKFTPVDVFPKVNETADVVFTADAFGSFSTNQSFLCKASVDHAFTTQQVTPVNFTLQATTDQLQIQFGNIVNGSFSSDTSECDQDKTSTPQPTSTAAPTTVLPPQQDISLNVTNGNVTCILMKGFFTISVTFEDTVAGKKVNRTGDLNIPADAVASGNCTLNATVESMQILFGNGWELDFLFSKDVSSSDDTSVSISEISVTYNTAAFKAASPVTKNVTMEKKGGFLKTNLGGYYQCNANSTCIDESGVKLTTTDFKYQAFRTKSDGNFYGSIAECPADEETSSVVPIAVGAALAGLVLIVLIAYLIGRRRSRKSGYESV